MSIPRSKEVRMAPPILFRNSLLKNTGIYAVNAILVHILDLRYEMQQTAIERVASGYMFTAFLGGESFASIYLAKRRVHPRRNSELDDRWYPAFAKVQEGLGEPRYFMLHFSPRDIHAFEVPPRVIGYTEVSARDVDRVLSGKRMGDVEFNRHARPKVYF